MTELNTNEILASVLDRYFHQIKSRNIEMKVAVLPNITADKVAIQEVFSNLIDNAIKYLRPGVPGVIKIRGKYINDRKYTLFSVADNGVGIPKELKNKVFQIMRRATLDKTIPGHGMGMPFVRSILKKHKGKIWFKSVPGEGSVFYFYIPSKA